jgi:hypothetical protein
MLERVGTGIQLLVDEGLAVVVRVDVVVVGGQVYTEIETVLDGAGDPDGAHLDLQPPREHELPGQLVLQYKETELHQVENSKQFTLPGHPAL